MLSGGESHENMFRMPFQNRAGGTDQISCCQTIAGSGPYGRRDKFGYGHATRVCLTLARWTTIGNGRFNNPLTQNPGIDGRRQRFHPVSPASDS